MNNEPWTYEGYWLAVCGLGAPEDIVNDWDLADEILKDKVPEWLAWAENEAWGAGDTPNDPHPIEWADYRIKAMAKLREAVTEIQNVGFDYQVQL